MGVEGRDLGHVADDIALDPSNDFGNVNCPNGDWAPYEPSSGEFGGEACR